MKGPVGIVLVGHGETASDLLAAARGIVSDGLEDVRAVDAGAGETAELRGRLCQAIEAADAGRGVVLMVDLVGASPCECAKRQGESHHVVVLSGLNLAMLLKLAATDRSAMNADGIAKLCAESAVRSVTVTSPTPGVPGRERGVR